MAVRSARGRRVLIGVGLSAAALLAPAVASAATTQVQVGDFNRTPEIEFNAVYPGTTTVTKGSKVRFSIVGFHTVTILKKGAKLPPFIAPSATLNPAQNDPADLPYWWGGTTPLIQFNGAAVGPTGGTVVTGARTVSSGLLNGNAPKFTVSFPKTGTYQVRCIIHPNLRGTVRVVAASGDTAKRQKARAARERAAQTATVTSLIAKAKAVAGNTVTISPGNKKAQVFAFLPATRSVAVGSTVTFNMAGGNEVHTVTFGPKAFVEAVSKKTYEGSGPDLAGEGFYPSDPPAAGVPAVTAASHGNGFLSSGALSDRATGIPAPHSFKVTFPVAGTFSYICLIHTDMKGTITVK